MDKIKVSQHQYDLINEAHNFWVYEQEFEQYYNEKQGHNMAKRVGQHKRSATDFEKQSHLMNLFVNGFINANAGDQKISPLQVFAIYYGSKEPEIVSEG